MPYAFGFACFGAHFEDNLPLKVGIDTMVASVYVVIIVFLFAACTLSEKRKQMYVLTNQLFVKISQSRNSPASLVILRRTIKSLGNTNKPTICLTDISGEEFEPME